jgi:hypothetical protein
MSTLETDLLQAATGTNTAIKIKGKGSGVVKIGDGELAFPDADGSANQIIKTDGSGTLSFIAQPSGGAWTFIQTVTASSSASLTVTGLDSTYDTFAVAVSDLIPATDGVHMYIRVGDSSGVDSGSSDYSNHTIMGTAGSTSYNATATAGNNQINLGFSVGNASGEGFGGLYYIHNPGDGSVVPLITGTSVYKTNGGVTEGGSMCATRDAVITLDRVQFIMSSGNITSGRVTAWGIKHA